MHSPGDVVRGYFSIRGWKIADRIVVLEGENDRRYFELASKLFFEQTGHLLLCDRLSMFPIGAGDLGGTHGIIREFPPLKTLIDSDVDIRGNKQFHAIALLDSDFAGKRAMAALTGQYLKYKEWRDVFLLRPILPRLSRDPVELSKLAEKENGAWKGLNCEIEDLISSGLMKCFIDDHPNCLERNPDQAGDRFHYEFKKGFKSQLVRFVEENAILADVLEIVETLRSLRHYLRLDTFESA